MAEIEHFVDPSDKSHPKFENVENVQVTMLPGSYQMSGRPALNITLKEAFDTVSRPILRLLLADTQKTSSRVPNGMFRMGGGGGGSEGVSL